MKKQNVKKTATLVGMFGLLGVVLGMGGSTLAKYYSTAAANAQTATVAKWGFVTNAQAKGLWGNEYKVDGNNVNATTNGNGGVVVKGDAAVLAPGTSGSMDFSVTGSAEVSAKIDVNLTYEKEVSLSDGTNFYYPVKWTLTDNNKTENKEVISGGTLLQVQEKVNALTSIVTPGAENTNFNYTISWAWAFSGSEKLTVKNLKTTENADDVLTVDEADTLLGLAAAGTKLDGYTAVTTTNLNLSINITQTQTQSTNSN